MMTTIISPPSPTNNKECGKSRTMHKQVDATTAQGSHSVL